MGKALISALENAKEGKRKAVRLSKKCRRSKEGIFRNCSETINDRICPGG
jgi:hypothetical protein